MNDDAMNDGAMNDGAMNDDAMTRPMAVIEPVIDRWHAHLRGELPGGLDELLHDDCVFWSPVVFSPQRGKELTTMYLAAAGNVLPGEERPEGASSGAGGGGTIARR